MINTSERRQNKDGHGMSAPAKRSHEVKPLAIGKAAIQNQNIVRPVPRKGVSVADGADMISKHIAPAQGFEKRARHFGFILKKQDSQ